MSQPGDEDGRRLAVSADGSRAFVVNIKPSGLPLTTSSLSAAVPLALDERIQGGFALFRENCRLAIPLKNYPKKSADVGYLSAASRRRTSLAVGTCRVPRKVNSPLESDGVAPVRMANGYFAVPIKDPGSFDDRNLRSIDGDGDRRDQDRAKNDVLRENVDAEKRHSDSHDRND
jgi:hypothetical protein